MTHRAAVVLSVPSPRAGVAPQKAGIGQMPAFVSGRLRANQQAITVSPLRGMDDGDDPPVTHIIGDMPQCISPEVQKCQ